jgi:hypothetical protein
LFGPEPGIGETGADGPEKYVDGESGPGDFLKPKKLLNFRPGGDRGVLGMEAAKSSCWSELILSRRFEGCCCDDIEAIAWLRLRDKIVLNSDVSFSFLGSAKRFFADLVLVVLSCLGFERAIGADLLRLCTEFGRDVPSGSIGEIRFWESSEVSGVGSA